MRKEDNSESSTPGWFRGLFITLISMVIFAILYLSGELALVIPLRIARADMNSDLKADYGFWVPMVLRPVDPAIIEDLRRDGRTIPTAVLVAGDYWLSPTDDMTPVSAATQILAYAPTVIYPVTVTPAEFALLSHPTLTPTGPFYQPPLVVVSTSTATKAPGPPLPSSTPIPAPTRRSTRSPVSTSTRSLIYLVTASPTPTKTPTRTPAPTDSPEPTHTATSTATNVFVPAPTDTPTHTHTPTYTATQTPTRTATSTATDTPTVTPTLTSTPIPHPPEIEIGPPDGDYYDLDCNTTLVLDLGSQTWVQTLIFYEFLNPSGCSTGICLDWIVINLSTSSDGPWTQVFYWGDAVSTNNGSVQPYHYATGERDNEVIPLAELDYGHGILMPVNDTYRYIQVYAPDSCEDEAQIDSFDILP